MESELLVVKLDDDKHPKYYNCMLEGRPRFGPKTKAVRMTDTMAETVARQLQQGWKIDCFVVNGLIRFGSKPKP